MPGLSRGRLWRGGGGSWPRAIGQIQPCVRVLRQAGQMKAMQRKAACRRQMTEGSVGPLAQSAPVAQTGSLPCRRLATGAGSASAPPPRRKQPADWQSATQQVAANLRYGIGGSTLSSLPSRASVNN